jgi:hypothetical protein
VVILAVQLTETVLIIRSENLRLLCEIMRKYGPIIWGVLNIQLNSTSRKKIYQLQLILFLFLPETAIYVATRQNVFLTMQSKANLIMFHFAIYGKQYSHPYT